MFMIADIAGAVPTLRDTWHDPRREAPEPWLLGLAGSAVNLTLVDPSAWAAGFGGFAIWGFPVYLAALNAGILALIARRQLPGSLYAIAALPIAGLVDAAAGSGVSSVEWKWVRLTRALTPYENAGCSRLLGRRRRRGYSALATGRPALAAPSRIAASASGAVTGKSRM